jgi:hypothetical protein
MIRLSHLFALRVKSRGVKDVSSNIYSGTFVVNEPCYRQVTNRHYAASPQGIKLIIFFLHITVFKCKSSGRLINARVLGYDETKIVTESTLLYRSVITLISWSNFDLTMHRSGLILDGLVKLSLS